MITQLKHNMKCNQTNNDGRCDGSQAGMTTFPVVASAIHPSKPEFIRLPKPRTLCPYTGLSRSKMNELVLPCPLNNFKPAVKSISLRNRGQVKAVRLVVYESLLSYLRSFLEEGGVMVVAFVFSAIAASAVGYPKNLEVSLQAQLARDAGCNLPLESTTAANPQTNSRTTNYQILL